MPTGKNTQQTDAWWHLLTLPKEKNVIEEFSYPLFIDDSVYSRVNTRKYSKDLKTDDLLPEKYLTFFEVANSAIFGHVLQGKKISTDTEGTKIAQ